MATMSPDVRSGLVGICIVFGSSLCHIWNAQCHCHVAGTLQAPASCVRTKLRAPAPSLVGERAGALHLHDFIFSRLINRYPKMVKSRPLLYANTNQRISEVYPQSHPEETSDIQLFPELLIHY